MHMYTMYSVASVTVAYVSSVVFDGELRCISLVGEVVRVPAEALLTPQDKCPLCSLLKTFKLMLHVWIYNS